MYRASHYWPAAVLPIAGNARRTGHSVGHSVHSPEPRLAPRVTQLQQDACAPSWRRETYAYRANANHMLGSHRRQLLINTPERRGTKRHLCASSGRTLLRGMPLMVEVGTEKKRRRTNRSISDVFPTETGPFKVTFCSPRSAGPTNQDGRTCADASITSTPVAWAVCSSHVFDSRL